MTSNELILRSQRVVTPSGVHAASIVIHRGKIIGITEPDAARTGANVEDFGDLVIMPGLVDTHVHVNEPGRTEWEGFATATRAAAAGGVTTLVDMPLNSVPATVSVPALDEKVAAARGQCWVDVGFWGGLVPGHADRLGDLAEAGVLGFKCFLVPSGVDEFPHVSLHQVREALPILHALELPLLVHAELPAPIDAATAQLQHEQADGRTYDNYLRSRPAEAELAAIKELIHLAERQRAHIHIVHLAAAEAVPMLADARNRGVPITLETCPHYLFFAASDVGAGATEFKCAPPIRDEANRAALWSALLRGDIDMVVSDHSPCEPSRKAAGQGDFFEAWGGIASVQLRLPAVWAGAREHGVGFKQLTRWLCERPAELAGLEQTKGSIAVGFDADLVVWDPDADHTVAPEQLQHRHKLTPYAGRTLPGVVRATYLRGEQIYDGTNVVDRPTGTTLLRSL